MFNAKSPQRRSGKGLVVYSNRWASESRLIRRILPQAWTKMAYFFRGRIQAKKTREYMSWFQSKTTAPLFSQVEIETQNRCNGSCAFCPVNRHEDPRPYARMSENLFHDIISQLADIKYSGALSLHSNNEPLMDKRLPEFAVLVKNRLPKARLKMFTNGSLLTLELFRQLMPNFSRLFINNYNSSPVMHPNVQEIHDYCLTEEGQRLLSGKTLVIQLRDPNVILSSRGGNAPNRQPPSSPVAAKCWYPYKQFVIRPDGRVSLCCNDALGQMTLGDINQQPITEIWRGESYRRLRKAMAEEGRGAIPLCAACDFVH